MDITHSRSRLNTPKSLRSIAERVWNHQRLCYVATVRTAPSELGETISLSGATLGRTRVELRPYHQLRHPREAGVRFCGFCEIIPIRLDLDSFLQSITISPDHTEDTPPTPTKERDCFV